MYSEQLEKLIEIALSDGEFTDKKKQVLFRRAEKEGIDLDEFEMVLESRIAKPINRPAVESPTMESPTVVAHREDTIHELLRQLREAEDISDKDIEAKLEQRRIEYNKLTVKGVAKLAGDIFTSSIPVVGFVKDVFSDGTDEDDEFELKQNKLKEELKEKLIVRKKNIISGFPLPKSEETILEFLSIAMPNTKKVGNIFTQNDSIHGDHNAFVAVWKAKCEQIIVQAKSSLANNSSAISQIDDYQKQMEPEKGNKFSSFFKR